MRQKFNLRWWVSAAGVWGVGDALGAGFGLLLAAASPDSSLSLSAATRVAAPAHTIPVVTLTATTTEPNGSTASTTLTLPITVSDPLPDDSGRRWVPAVAALLGVGALVALSTAGSLGSAATSFPVVLLVSALGSLVSLSYGFGGRGGFQKGSTQF